MNRHQRRAQDVQHDKSVNEHISKLSRSGPMSLTVVMVSTVMDDPFHDPDVFAGFMHFVKMVREDGRPLCLLCDLEWTSIAVPPPALLAVVRTQEFFRDKSQSGVEMVSAICATCSRQKDKATLIAKCLTVYRKIWPDLRATASPLIHDAPNGVQ
jgi:hypothetical protein